MTSLRHRPISWLALLATVVLDIALLSTGVASVWLAGLLVGQMMAVGVWTALGSAHRLTRATLFVAAAAGLSCLLTQSNGSLNRSTWFHFVTVALLVQGTVAFAATAAFWSRRFWKMRRDRQRAEPLRFPLVEIFGWTIVISLASMLFRLTTFERVLRNPGNAAFWLLGCFACGLVSGLVEDAGPASGVRSRLLALVVIGLFWIGLPLLAPRTYPMDSHVMVVAQLYLAMFLLCRVLDPRPTPPDSSGPPPLKIAGEDVATF